MKWAKQKVPKKTKHITRMIFLVGVLNGMGIGFKSDSVFRIVRAGV